MIIRRFENEDAIKVSEMIVDTLRTVNNKDYSKEFIEKEIITLSPKHIIEQAGWMHLYVVCEGENIIGCGYWGSEKESSLFTIFVSPKHYGKGIGRQIIETLEKDKYYLRAKRIEIPASITALKFYQKMGYDFKKVLIK